VLRLCLARCVWRLQVTSYESRISCYERDLCGLVGEKRYLMRTMKLYAQVQHGAMRTIEEIGPCTQTFRRYVPSQGRGHGPGVGTAACCLLPAQ
jgi:hypothetical protein